MIDAKIDCDAEKIEVQLNGSVADICSKLGWLIGHVYSRCLAIDPKTAAGMRYLMVALVSDKSPVWIPDAEFGSAKEEKGKAGAT